MLEVETYPRGGGDPVSWHESNKYDNISKLTTKDLPVMHEYIWHEATVQRCFSVSVFLRQCHTSKTSKLGSDSRQCISSQKSESRSELHKIPFLLPKPVPISQGIIIHLKGYGSEGWRNHAARKHSIRYYEMITVRFDASSALEGSDEIE